MKKMNIFALLAVAISSVSAWSSLHDGESPLKKIRTLEPNGAQTSITKDHIDSLEKVVEKILSSTIKANEGEKLFEELAKGTNDLNQFIVQAPLKAEIRVAYSTLLLKARYCQALLLVKGLVKKPLNKNATFYILTEACKMPNASQGTLEAINYHRAIIWLNSPSNIPMKKEEAYAIFADLYNKENPLNKRAMGLLGICEMRFKGLTDKITDDEAVKELTIMYHEVRDNGNDLNIIKRILPLKRQFIEEKEAKVYFSLMMTQEVIKKNSS